MALLRERQVENAIRRHLKHKFGEHRIQDRVSQHGIDICYTNKNGRPCRVEVEGNAREDGKPLSSPSARYTHFYRCLGQICIDIGRSSKGTLFEIGLPLDPLYKRYTRIATKAMKLLGVKKIYWVDKAHKRTRVIEQLTR